MDAVIIYESLTGTTRAAALAMHDELFSHRIGCRTYPVAGFDPEAVAAANLVIVGSWTDGLLVVGQRPGRKGRIAKALPPLDGKPCAVYCTYAVTPGRTLDKLGAVVEKHGGRNLGGLAIHRNDLANGARTFIDRVLDVALV